jgi:hypothetical protein
MKVLCSLIAAISVISAGVFTSSSYARVDPESVVGIWLFDEGEDDTAYDASGAKHDGEILGNVKWVDGKFGKALDFPGAPGSFVSIPDEEKLNLVTWSVIAWVKINKGVSGEYHVVVKEEPSVTRNYGIVVKQDFAYPTFTSGASVWKNVAGKTPVADGEWHHIAITYDKVVEKLYIDGVLDVQANYTDTPDTTPGPLGIGAGGTKGDVAPTKGVIDEVALFNVALTEDDIRDIMNNGIERAFALPAVLPLDKLTSAWGGIKIR